MSFQQHAGMDPSTLPVRVGQNLGKYLITGFLGRGGTGVVFQGMHQVLQVPVAIKLLQPGLLQNDRRLHQQLQTEARVLAQLNHPHLIRVWDFEDDPALPYVVLELVTGSSLDQLIERSGRIRPDRALTLLTQVASGLSYAHANGVLHRDIKPGNILLTADGTVKVADLGQAAMLAGAEALTSLSGTPAYMAPEQLLGTSPLDQRSDIYSLGATFYHALTGQLPYEARTIAQLQVLHQGPPPPPILDLVADVPPAFVEIIETMMAREPDDRYSQSAELVESLRALREELGPSQETRRVSVISTSRPLTEQGHGAGALARPNQETKRVRAVRPSLFTTQEAGPQHPTHRGGPPSREVRRPAAPEPPPAQAPDPLATARQFTREGIAAAKGGDKARAREMFSRALELDPTCEFSWLWLGSVAESADEAAHCWEQVLQINPENKDARKALARVRPPAPEAAAPAAPPRRTVLVIDDSATIVKMVQMTLQQYGFEVLSAGDGAAGLAVLRDRMPHLVLLDIMLPGADGYEICKQICSDTRTKHIPVVMLSGKGGLFSQLRGKWAGTTAYITKPFQPEVLVQVVDKHCLKPVR